jgi:hypothetical protein
MIDFLNYLIEVGTDGSITEFVKNNIYLCGIVAGYLSWKYPKAFAAIRDFLMRGVKVG